MIAAPEDPSTVVGGDRIVGLLADHLVTTAASRADQVFHSLSDFAACGHALSDIAQHIGERGLAPLDAWADAMALAGVGREPWVREVALRAVRAYAARLGELMESLGADTVLTEVHQ